MNDAAPFRPSAAAPDCLQSYGVILAGLAAAIARLFLRRPDLVLLTVPLWTWLNRSVRRLERAMTRPVVPARVREVAPPSDTGEAGEARARARVRLPGRAGWLVREFGWEMAGFGSQLQHLLGQPEMQAVLAARPGVGRILRPICRMLGVRDVVGLARTVATAEAAPAKVRVVRVRRVRPEVWQPGRAALREGGFWMVRPRAKRG